MENEGEGVEAAGQEGDIIGGGGGEGKGEEEEKRRFAIGDNVVCVAAFDSEQHEATIVDVKPARSVVIVTPNKKSNKNDNNENELCYYVHYTDFDKRLDEWVSGDHLERKESATCASPSVNFANQNKHKDKESDVIDPSIATDYNFKETVNTSCSAPQSYAASPPHAQSSELPGLLSPQTPKNDNKYNASQSTPTTMTRQKKRRFEEMHHVYSPELDMHMMSAEDAMFEKRHQQTTKIKNIQIVQFGEYEINAWYYSPYPIKAISNNNNGNNNKNADVHAMNNSGSGENRSVEESEKLKINVSSRTNVHTNNNNLQNHQDSIHSTTEGLHCLYVCPRCFKYMKQSNSLKRHSRECTMSHPPGRCIYKSVSCAQENDTVQNMDEHIHNAREVRVYQVDGQQQKLYCQNLCLFAKLFLDHKTLYFDIVDFMFFVVCERKIITTGKDDDDTNDNDDGNGVFNVVGYFSKEKQSSQSYNLACILTLPQYQKQGVGTFMIELAYELSCREGVIGTPERPLSDMGLVCFRSYWRKKVLHCLKSFGVNQSLKEIATRTGFMMDDVIATLQQMNLIKHWRGQQILTASTKNVEDYLRASITSSMRRRDDNCSGSKSSNNDNGSKPMKLAEFDPSYLVE